DAYLSHVGTLQHKLSFMTGAGGVVHGPSEQMINQESGPYHSEIGQTPTYLSGSAVEDIPTNTERGSRSFDYRIVDIEAISNSISAIFKARSKARVLSLITEN